MPVQIPDIPHAYRIDATPDSQWHAVHIAPDGQTVYLHQHTLMVDLVSTLIDTAQTIVVLMLLVIGLWSIAYLIRHRRELRKPGVPSCLRCHYDLTGIVAVEEVPHGKQIRFQTNGEPARPNCPECGANLKAHKPIVGQRVLQIYISQTSILACFAFVIAFSAVFWGGWQLKPHVSWLSEGAGSWANRQPIRHIRNTARPRDVLNTIDPATGAVDQLVAREHRTSSSGRLSPDGRSWIRFANEGIRAALLSTPIQPGGHALAQRIPIGSSFNFTRRILAFTDKGNAVLIVGTDDDDLERLLEIDLATGRFDEHFSRRVRNHLYQGNWYPDQFEEPRYFIRHALDTSSSLRGSQYEFFRWDNSLQPRRTVTINDPEAVPGRTSIINRSVLAVGAKTDEIIAVPASRGHELVRLDRETGNLLAAIPAVRTSRRSRGEIQLGWQDDRLIFLTLPNDHAIFVYDLIHDQWIARLTHPADLTIQSLAINPKADHIHAVGWFPTGTPGTRHTRWPHGMNTALLAWDTTPIREALARLDAANP